MKTRMKPKGVKSSGAKLLRLDPSRTGDIRKRFEQEVTKRLNRVKSRIVQDVVFKDAFGRGPTVNADWSGLPQNDQVKAFEDYLLGVFADEMTGKAATSVWEMFIMQALARGAKRSFDEYIGKKQSAALKPDMWKMGARDQFLQTAFTQPIAKEKIQLLVSRPLRELKGMTDATANTLLRTLADGLAQGKGPRQIGREIAKVIDDMSVKRATTIARTEIIRAHAEGQLIALKQLGVQEVGAMVEWSTVKDGKVCAKCKPLQGIVLKIDEATGLLPRHPNCRCAWTPANVGEKPDGQKRSKPAIMGAIAVSKSNSSKKDKWGEAVAITEERPPIFQLNVDARGNPKDVVSAWMLVNAFCPTGKGGGIDPSCSPGTSGGSTDVTITKIHAAKGSTPFTELYTDKLKALNPNGVENGVFHVPSFPAGEKSSLDKLAVIESVLPAGTVIKKKSITGKQVEDWKTGQKGKEQPHTVTHTDKVIQSLPTSTEWKVDAKKIWDEQAYTIGAKPEDFDSYRMTGQCGPSCIVLHQKLKAKGIETTFTHGTYDGDDHFWLQTKQGLIIDPTETQFEKGIPLGVISIHEPDSPSAKKYQGGKDASHFLSNNVMTPPVVSVRVFDEFRYDIYQGVKDDEEIVGVGTGKFKLTTNAFCPTGKGGGIDPSCGGIKLPPPPTFISSNKAAVAENNKAIGEMRFHAAKGDAAAVAAHPGTPSPKVQQHKQDLLAAIAKVKGIQTTTAHNPPPPTPPSPQEVPVVKGGSVGAVKDHVVKATGYTHEQLKAGLSGPANPGNKTAAVIRANVTGTIYEGGHGIKDAALHVIKSDNPAAKADLIKGITTGNPTRSLKEFADTPIYDLHVLTGITQSPGQVQGQAVCYMASRVIEMGSTSVTGDYRHELGHAIRSALGGESPGGKTAIVKAIQDDYAKVQEKVKADPSGLKMKLSHDEYETKYGVVGRRSLDNWEEHFAEHYRLYHREIYKDVKEGGSGKYLAQYRERHPTWANIWDAHYTAALIGQQGGE